jgi:hypothetical protein
MGLLPQNYGGALTTFDNPGKSVIIIRDFPL